MNNKKFLTWKNILEEYISLYIYFIFKTQLISKYIFCNVYLILTPPSSTSIYPFSVQEGIHFSRSVIVHSVSCWWHTWYTIFISKKEKRSLIFPPYLDWRLGGLQPLLQPTTSSSPHTLAKMNSFLDREGYFEEEDGGVRIEYTLQKIYLKINCVLNIK